LTDFRIIGVELGLFTLVILFESVGDGGFEFGVGGTGFMEVAFEFFVRHRIDVGDRATTVI
jgi:hypothetical protein